MFGFKVIQNSDSVIKTRKIINKYLHIVIKYLNHTKLWVLDPLIISKFIHIKKCLKYNLISKCITLNNIKNLKHFPLTSIKAFKNVYY